MYKEGKFENESCLKAFLISQNLEYTTQKTFLVSYVHVKNCERSAHFKKIKTL